MKSIVSSLKSRRKKPLSVAEFLKISAAIQKIETHTGVIGSIYQEMRSVGEIYIQSGRWVRIPLQSFCLNSGRASPREDEVYTLSAVPAKDGQWLSPLMRYNRLQTTNQSNIQSVVWRMKSGASYRDLNKSDQAVIKEAIPDADKPFLSLAAFFKTLPGRWKDTFQDTGRIASELSQRQSNEPMKEPATRWMQLDDGLAVRVDRLMGYGTTYVTIANINNSGFPVEFDPADYILKPSRKSVQELSLSPAWADKWWGELARLIDETDRLIAEVGVIFVPGVNDAVDLYEFLIGKDFLSGKTIDPEDHSLAALGLILGSGRGYRKGADGLGEFVKEARREGVVAKESADGAESAIRRAEQFADKYQNYADPKFARRLEKQLQEDGPGSLKRSLRSLEKMLNQHVQELPALERTSSVEREIRTFKKQIDTLNKFIEANNIR